MDRTWGSSRPDIHMLDLESPLMRLMLNRAKTHEFGGHAAGVAQLPGVAIVAAVLRWQNEQGRRMRQEFSMVCMFGDVTTEVNSKKIVDWLRVPADDGVNLPNDISTERLMDSAQQAVDQRIADVSNPNLHPENKQWVAAAWKGNSIE